MYKSGFETNIIKTYKYHTYLSKLFILDILYFNEMINSLFKIGTLLFNLLSNIFNNQPLFVSLKPCNIIKKYH